MKVYAIRHIPTGQFMPVPTGKNGSGSSYWEPAETAYCRAVLDLKPQLPRLFTLRRSASSALTQWLRGRHIVEYEWSNPDDTFGRSVQEPVGTSVEPVPSRKADDMEIVAFELVEVSK